MGGSFQGGVFLVKRGDAKESALDTSESMFEKVRNLQDKVEHINQFRPCTWHIDSKSD